MSGDYQEYDEDQRMSQEMFLDDKDFFSKFLFKPQIDDDADYRHLDKNLAITRLASRYKEPEIARNILRALHVLSNPKYFREVTKEKLIGFRTEQIKRKRKDGDYELIEMKIPVYQEEKVLVSYYPKTYHRLKSKFFALTTTSMARDGHLLKGATTKHLHKSESIEDRTKKNSNFFGLASPNKSDRRY